MQMHYINLNKAVKTKEIMDTKKQFRLLYVPEIDTYFMEILVWWIAAYERYYKISEADYALYQEDKEAFYNKYSREISQNPDICFTECFSGANALRDYDGENQFQDSFPLPQGMVNAFQHFVYVDGILYARIVWEDGEIFVPPVQAIKTGDEDYRYPLREKCDLQKNSMGQPICYKLKREYFQNI